MTLELHDTASHDDSIANTSAQQLSVDTTKADFVEILIDDGTTNSSPSSYDIRVDYYSTATDDWMVADSASGITAFSPSVTTDCRGQQYRISVTNQSGSGANFRISLEAFAEI